MRVFALGPYHPSAGPSTSPLSFRCRSTKTPRIIGWPGCPNARWTALAEATPFPLSAVGFAQTFHDICANALATCTMTRSRRSRGARQLAWKDDTSCGEDLVASLTDALQRLKRATDAVTSRRGNQQAGARQSLAAGGEGLELRKRRDG